jgi:hypothetical protein
LKKRVLYFFNPVLNFTLLLAVLGMTLPTLAGSDDLTLSEYRSQMRPWSRHHIEEILADRIESSEEVEIPTLAHHLLALCRYYKMDPAFVLSMIQVESSFKVEALSPMGAVGLMQLMPATAEVMMREMNLQPAMRLTRASVRQSLFNPFVNLTLGVAYLAYLRDHYQAQPLFYQVAAYNVGPARLDELLSNKNFKPVSTKKYYEAVQRGIFQFRTYLQGSLNKGLPEI